MASRVVGILQPSAQGRLDEADPIGVLRHPRFWLLELLDESVGVDEGERCEPDDLVTLARKLQDAAICRRPGAIDETNRRIRP